MNKQLHFLSGLPRSGSTVLSALLNQHPECYATNTSPFLDYLLPAVEHLKNIQQNHASGHHIDVSRVLMSAAFSFYDTDKPRIIDKNRGWFPNYKAIETDLLSEPKIIVTLRPIEQVVTSFYRVINHLNGGSETPEQIFVGRISEVYLTLKESAKYKDRVCVITYDQLITQPEQTMNTIEQYLLIDAHTYDFEHIVDPDPEDDHKWGIPHLHEIRPQLESQSLDPADVMTRTELNFCAQLTEELYDAYGIDSSQ